MVHVEGNATTGYAGNGPEHIDLPKPVMTRVSHRPWCVDCKRKHDADQLDDAGRCARCARAAVSRAEAEARRAERADEIAALEKAAQTAVVNAARKTGTVVRRITTPKPPKEDKTGKPTTRSSAPRATSTGSNSGRAPDAGSSTTEKPSTGTPAGGAPRQDPVEAPGPMPSDTVADLVRRASTTNNILVRTCYDTAISALTALKLALDTQSPAAATSTPAAAGPADSTAPSPAVEPAPQTTAGHGEGEAPARRSTRKPRATHIDEAAIRADYENGDTTSVIAERHNLSRSTVHRTLDRLGVPRRDDRALASGGKNRFEPTAEQITHMRRAYVDDEHTVAEIAEQMGLHRRIVSRVLVDAGVNLRPAAHLTGTVLTNDMAAAIVQRYADGAAIADLCRDYRLRNDRVREVITAAGHTVRTKGASSRNSERMAALGTNAREVKTWAVQTGRATHITSGLVPASLIDAWEQEHQPRTTQPTGDTAA